MEKRKKLVKFLFDNQCCLSCTPRPFCGVFSDEETCLKCIDDELTELLQHNVSNNEVAVCDHSGVNVTQPTKWEQTNC